MVYYGKVFVIDYQKMVYRVNGNKIAYSKQHRKELTMLNGIRLGNIMVDCDDE